MFTEKTPESDLTLAPFIKVGFDVLGSSGDEAYGNCIFCDSENKFYVNKIKSQFICHRCGESGNLVSFLTKFVELYKGKFEDRIDSLAEFRELDPRWVKDSGVIYTGDMYWFPVRGRDGSVVNLRWFTPTKKVIVRGLPNIDAKLWGVERILPTTKRVYVTEGEWDCIALRQIIAQSEYADRLRSNEWVVVSVPGASIWKLGWRLILDGKDVILCYDNDDPGRKGCRRAWDALLDRSGGEVSYIQWPDGLATGFDIRDLLIAGGDLSLITEMTVSSWPDKEAKIFYGKASADPPDARPSFEEVLRTYRKWLVMTGEHEVVLRILYAAALTSGLQGDPLWVYIVGPPGSGKTEILMSIAGCPCAVVASSITARSLVSGFPGSHGDPSLIPKLKNKLFVLKDFTEILQMPKNHKEEIYGILRGAYDGETKKEFGNGVVRIYEGRFHIVAGVTSAIDADDMSSMGERFLKYRMASGGADARRECIIKALGQVGVEDTMKKEIKDVTIDFFSLGIEGLSIPKIEGDLQSKLISLAEVISLLRANVDRSNYNRDIISYIPEPEVGTRIAKQLKKLLIGLSMVRQSDTPNLEDYEILKRVALSSCIPFQLQVAKLLFVNGPLTEYEIVDRLFLPRGMIREVLESMRLCRSIVQLKPEEPNGSVRRKPGPVARQWAVSRHLVYHWNWSVEGVLPRQPLRLKRWAAARLQGTV